MFFPVPFFQVNSVLIEQLNLKNKKKYPEAFSRTQWFWMSKIRIVNQSFSSGCLFFNSTSAKKRNSKTKTEAANHECEKKKMKREKKKKKKEKKDQKKGKEKNGKRQIRLTMYQTMLMLKAKEKICCWRCGSRKWNEEPRTWMMMLISSVTKTQEKRTETRPDTRHKLRLVRVWK